MSERNKAILTYNLTINFAIFVILVCWMWYRELDQNMAPDLFYGLWPF